MFHTKYKKRTKRILSILYLKHTGLPYTGPFPNCLNMRGRKTQLGFAFTTLNFSSSKSAREKSEARHLREQALANEFLKEQVARSPSSTFLLLPPYAENHCHCIERTESVSSAEKEKSLYSTVRFSEPFSNTNCVSTHLRCTLAKNPFYG